jgi:hypothetical protein
MGTMFGGYGQNLLAFGFELFFDFYGHVLSGSTV